MSKKIIASTIILFVTYSNFAEANSKIDPEFLKPDNVKKMLSVATEKSKEEMEPISKLYHEYKNAFAAYVEEYLPIFKDYFDEDDGNARHGYVPVKNVE